MKSKVSNAAYMREWRKKNIDRARLGENSSKKRRREALFCQILDAYGAVCSCCGEHRRRFLTLEHTNRDGAAHRASRPGNGVYLDVVRAGFPKDYTILCLNCNWARRFGACPHELERQGIIEQPFEFEPYKRPMVYSEEGRAAVTAAVVARCKGVPKSPEHRAKVAEGMKRYWASLASERKAEVGSQTLRRRWV